MLGGPGVFCCLWYAVLWWGFVVVVAVGIGASDLVDAPPDAKGEAECYGAGDEDGDEADDGECHATPAVDGDDVEFSGAVWFVVSGGGGDEVVGEGGGLDVLVPKFGEVGCLKDGCYFRGWCAFELGDCAGVECFHVGYGYAVVGGDVEEEVKWLFGKCAEAHGVDDFGCVEGDADGCEGAVGELIGCEFDGDKCPFLFDVGAEDGFSPSRGMVVVGVEPVLQCVGVVGGEACDVVAADDFALNEVVGWGGCCGLCGVLVVPGEAFFGALLWLGYVCEVVEEVGGCGGADVWDAGDWEDDRCAGVLAFECYAGDDFFVAVCVGDEGLCGWDAGGKWHSACRR